MCATTTFTQQSDLNNSTSRQNTHFKVLLPLKIHLHDDHSFQKARKLGILKPNHLNKLSLWKSSLRSNSLPAHSILPLTKAKHLKTFQYKSHQESFDNRSNTFGKLFPISSINLSKLCIELNQCYRPLENRRLPSLTKIINIVPTLRELYLKVSSSRRLGPKDIVNDKELLGIVHGLSRLVYLNSFHIELRDCQKISNQGISAFSSAFNRLSQLQEFSFCMTQNTTISDDIIARIFGSLWKLSELVTLTIDLTGSYKVGDCSVNVLAESLSYLPKLKKLCVRLDGCQVGAESVKNMLEAIEKLNKLEEWELILGQKRKEKTIDQQSSNSPPQPKADHTSGKRSVREVEGELQERLNTKTRRTENVSIFPIGKTLGSLRRLQKLKLSLHESWAKGDELIWDLSWGFPQLRNLNELSLRIFSENWSEIINDVNIRMLCKAISRLGRTLELLHLDFQWSKTATDNGMTSLAESIILLKELKDLNLNFGEWNRITDKGIASLAKGLSHLEKLEKLTLRLNGVYNVGDEGVKRISEGLRHLSGLNLLHLNLERCSMVTEDALVKVGRVLGMLNDFQELCIDLEGCEQLQGDGLYKMLTSYLGDQPIFCEISCVKLVLKHMSKVNNGSSFFGAWSVQKEGEMGNDSPEYVREAMLI